MTKSFDKIEEVQTQKVTCNGDANDGSGHPMIWLQLSLSSREITCPYCDKKFVYKELNK